MTSYNKRVLNKIMRPIRNPLKNRINEKELNEAFEDIMPIKFYYSKEKKEDEKQ